MTTASWPLGVSHTRSGQQSPLRAAGAGALAPAPHCRGIILGTNDDRMAGITSSVIDMNLLDSAVNPSSGLGLPKGETYERPQTNAGYGSGYQTRP